MPATSLEQIVSLAKRRGFVFPSSSVYGGLGSTWDYGPLGVELKNNVKRAWWRKVVHERDDMEGLDAAILMNRLVWKYSGHEATFSDPMTDCRACKRRPRADHVFEAQKGRDPMGLAGDQRRHRGQGAEVPEVRLQGSDRGAPLQPDVPTTVGAGRHRRRERPGLPAPRDRAGHLRQLRQRAGHHAPQAALRHRPDRQGVPQRDHARQLHLPDARVRADGDRVLRASRARTRPRTRRGSTPARSGTSTSACARENLRQREQDEGRAGPLRQALRRPRVPVSHGLERARGHRQPHRLRPEGAQPQAGEPRLGRRAAATSIRKQKKHIVPYVIEPSAGADRATLAFLCDAYEERWSRSRRPRRSAKLRELVAELRQVGRQARQPGRRGEGRAWSRRRRQIAAGLPGTLPRLLALSDDADANRIEVIKKVRGVAEKLGEEFTRTVLRLHPRLAPIKVAVFPLKKNEPRLVEMARGLKKDAAGGRAARRLRRHRRHRQALPPPGRDRHPVLHHGRLPEPGGPDRHRPRPRHHGPGARRHRRARGRAAREGRVGGGGPSP